MLHPVKTLPEEASNAAPTRKLEYGAWAVSIARRAMLPNSLFEILICP